MKIGTMAAVAAMGVLVAAAGAGEPSPYRGLYFHEFTGTFNGSEWSTWGPIEGDGRLEFSDLTADGSFPATVAGDGTFTLDNGNGTGAFTSDDEAFIDFTLPGFTFHSTMTRAAYTDADFPVFFTEAVAGDGALTGAWRARVLDVDPRTGKTLDERTETVDVSVSGTTVRVAEADGSFVQGVWMSGTQAGFRFIQPTPRDEKYRSFPGSDLSENLNMVGDLRVLEDGSMTLAVFFQTRTPIGTQVQTMRYYELTRVPAPGTASVMGVVGLVATRRRR